MRIILFFIFGIIITANAQNITIKGKAHASHIGKEIYYRGYKTNCLELCYQAAKNPEALVPDLSITYDYDTPNINFVDLVFKNKREVKKRVCFEYSKKSLMSWVLPMKLISGLIIA